MGIDKELDEILNDPLFGEIETEEANLFDVPEDMQKVMARRKQPEHYAQKQVCEDFERFRPLFQQAHLDLKEGRRSLFRTSKSSNMEAGNFYIVEGQMIYLDSIGEMTRARNGMPNARTRCIYENGTESDILLETLRKNVMQDGYAVSQTQEQIDSAFSNDAAIGKNDQVTGYIYVLRSLADIEEIRQQKNLYKIGFTTDTVEKRIANATAEPTYLMADVEVVAQYKVVNMNSHVFEDLVHQVFSHVNYHVEVKDAEGNIHHPREWYVAPLPIIDKVIERILDSSITEYIYNAQMETLEHVPVKKVSKLDTSKLKVLTLNIKKEWFDLIMNGEKTEEFRELKQTTLNKYTYLDDADGKRYLRRYDAIRFYVGYHKDRESALVQVTNTRYASDAQMVVYSLGMILEHQE